MPKYTIYFYAIDPEVEYHEKYPDTQIIEAATPDAAIDKFYADESLFKNYLEYHVERIEVTE